MYESNIYLVFEFIIVNALFRIPKSIDRANEWKVALGYSETTHLSGLVCKNHFQSTDFRPPTKTHPLVLREDAVPSIFEIESLDSLSENLETLQLSILTDNECNECESCISLRSEYAKLNLGHDIEKAKLTARIEKLEKDLSQCRHEKKLAHRSFKYTKDQNKKLSDTLAQLKKKSLLDAKVVQFVEVSSLIACIFTVITNESFLIVSSNVQIISKHFKFETSGAS